MNMEWNWWNEWIYLFKISLMSIFSWILGGYIKLLGFVLKCC